MADEQTLDRTPLSPASCFSLLALVLLGTRFVQGFIFWGGASRRLFYDYREADAVHFAVKLDFDSAGFVSNKLTHALPGVLWVQGPIEWTLAHPDLLLASVWVWTLIELAVGLGLIFGWMGSTCLDEWTMAVSGVAMSSAVFLAGGGAWSLDSLIGRTAWAERNGWTAWLFSGPFPFVRLKAMALVLAAVAVLFTIGSYSILFGAVVSPLHSRVDFHRHAIALSKVTVAADGAVTFDAYVDAGPDTGAAYIIAARLVDASGATIAEWDGTTLAGLPATSIRMPGPRTSRPRRSVSAGRPARGRQSPCPSPT